MSAGSGRGPKVRVALYGGPGTNPNRLGRELARFGFEVSPIDERGLPAIAPRQADVLYLPGGWYPLDGKTNAAIRRYVRSGGGCVGTCAGAYVVAGYSGLIPGRVLREEMRGRLYLEPQDGNHPILRGVVRRCTRHRQRRWEPIAVTHMGGPFILPKDRRRIVASYDHGGEIGALVAADFGRGRAVAIASHPELALADLPSEDVLPRGGPLPQGDTRLIVRNAVLWAAHRAVPRG